MKLRDFDPAQEKLAAEWAKSTFIDPTGWVNEDGQTLAEAALAYYNEGKHDHYRSRLGAFTKDGITAFAKARYGLPFAKLVADLSLEADLPVAPEALIKIETSDDYAEIVNLSMAPFIQHDTAWDEYKTHPITTIAMVIDSWIQNPLGHDYGDVCVDASFEGSPRTALFDFEHAVHQGKRRDISERKVIMPEYAYRSDLNAEVAHWTVAQILALPKSIIQDVVSRIPDEKEDKKSKKSICKYFEEMRTRLPQLIDQINFPEVAPVFGKARLG